MMTELYAMSDQAIPPGEYLEEVLDDFGINQAELARRMGRPPQAINEIIKGEKSITPETSLQLEKVLGVPAHVWSRLESGYRLILAQQAETAEATKETELIKEFPYAELVKLGLLANTRASVEKIENLRRYFGVASLFNLDGVKAYSPAFRQNTSGDINHQSLAAWLRAGTIFAEQIECNHFEKELLVETIPNIRSLTLEPDPNAVISNLKTLLQNCGVALVVIPHFKKTHTTGATFWLKKEKAVLMMSLRGSWADIFWFSLFHELGHILLHGKSATFLEDGPHNNSSKQEQEADLFAQMTLIPRPEFKKFESQRDFSYGAVKAFASSIGVAPGIIVGRLQHETLLPYTNNSGRIRYKWK